MSEAVQKPGRIVMSILKQRCFNANAVASKIGMERQKFHSLLSGSTKITPDVAIKLAKFFKDYTAKDFLLMQAKYDIEQVASKYYSMIEKFATPNHKASTKQKSKK